MYADTLHETLDEAAGKSPDIRATFPSESSSITLAELAASSTEMARGLLAAGIAPGDRVGLLCPNEPRFLQTLFALNRIGAAACPLPLPATLADLEGYVARLTRIGAAAGIRHVVVTDQFGALIDALDGMLPGVTLVRPSELSAGSSGGELPRVDPGSTAIVQFTSGSTATPKGVQLTHTNVLTCLDAIVDGVAMGQPGDSGGIWLPMYHDMGLFGTLSALLIGVPVRIWSPLAFVKNPARWLRTVAETGTTICPSPNFGYDYLLSAVAPEEAAGYDLSRWRVAFNGAETIAVDSVEAFLDRFAPAGFRPETMFPVYGLAEATLAVTFPPLGRAPRYDWVDGARLAAEHRAVRVSRDAPGARGIVGVGRAVRGMRVRVADPVTGREVADDRVAEVQARGGSVAAGYLTDDPGVAQPFTPDGWLKTGDLGYLRDGELFLTGRIKEMIVVRGVNFYPEDVEAVVRTIPGVYKRRCVGFTGTGEAMTLVAETDLTEPADRSRLAAEILARVSAVTGLNELDVRLLPPRSIPRTTSGKLQRLAMRDDLGRQAQQ
jgi:fatty-acyl-CoA synthase